MERTLDMKSIRYINLFEKITKTRAQHCFLYNSAIVFIVSRDDISRAIGSEGRNIKKLTEIMGKRVKVVAIPAGKQDLARFISAVIHPVKFKSIEVKGDSLAINAGRQSKATLIGRNKCRLAEMQEILESYFGIKELRVI